MAHTNFTGPVAYLAEKKKDRSLKPRQLCVLPWNRSGLQGGSSDLIRFLFFFRSLMLRFSRLCPVWLYKLYAAVNPLEHFRTRPLDAT